MTTRRISRTIQRDPDADREIAAGQVAELEAQLGIARTFQEASKTFQVALDAYIRSFPQGLDHYDPDMELDRALDFSLDMGRAAIHGIESRLKEARVRVKRLGERRLA